jgi:hypothetical protein
MPDETLISVRPRPGDRALATISTCCTDVLQLSSERGHKLPSRQTTTRSPIQNTLDENAE